MDYSFCGIFLSFERTACVRYVQISVWDILFFMCNVDFFVAPSETIDSDFRWLYTGVDILSLHSAVNNTEAN